MSEQARNYLKPGQTIELTDDLKNGAVRRYTIRSVIGEGGSAVCYEAVREIDGMTGMLKEFYPADIVLGNQQWFYALERLENGQLVPERGTIGRFNELCEEYLSAYRKLNQIISRSKNNRVLKNFIQYSDILYGYTDHSTKDNSFFTRLKRSFEDQPVTDHIHATVYIWSAGVEGLAYDRYLKELCREPERNANFKMRDILDTFISLTDCLKAMHTAGLVHLDMKPSNFLLSYDSEGKVRPGHISMFDINTIYDISSDNLKCAGTKGYSAPELARGKADNRSDIYSIGAMLFQSVVITKHTSVKGEDVYENALYQNDYYDQIDQLVRHSVLIEGSDSNSDVHFMSALASILKKCLAVNPEARYDSCTKLLKDLKTAKQISVVNTIRPDSSKTDTGITDPVVVIQKLLDDHPLYQEINPGSNKIRVLTIGSGTYSQRFIDLCLQTGQMDGYTLEITAASNAPEADKAAYLQFRPAIRRFVDINHSYVKGKSVKYAVLNFKAVSDLTDGIEEASEGFKTDRSGVEDNRAIVNAVIERNIRRNESFDYIFVALGSDRLNSSIAKMFADNLAEQPDIQKCPVCYITEKKTRLPKADKKKRLYPVCINEQITPEKIIPELDSMTFKTHLSWGSSMNVDIEDEWKKLRGSGYNYRSSMAYVLSIRYKLFSIGIDPTDLEKAAEQFYTDVLQKRSYDENARKKFNLLVMYEHRRWVLSLVTEGWTPPLNKRGNLRLQNCVDNGRVKNELKRTHPCLVDCTADSPLTSAEYMENNRAKWDDPAIDPDLDELDHMSVELHQKFAAAARQFKLTNPIESDDLKAIRQMIPGSEADAVRAFNQYHFCLKNILNGSETYSKQYSRYQKTLEDAVVHSKRISAHTASEIKDRLQLIKTAFYPVREANFYRNYKENDYVLIEKIPFITTYKLQPSIAMAFAVKSEEDSSNEAVFGNVAAATVLSPREIHYLYYCEKDQNENLMIRKLSAVINYLACRKVHSKVTFTAVCPQTYPKERIAALKRKLTECVSASADQSNAYLEKYEVLECADQNECSGMLVKYLQKLNVDLYDGTTALYRSQMDNTELLVGIRKAGIPYYDFDWKNKSFRTSGCNYLKYVKDESFISINDMFALSNAVPSRLIIPEFAEDYQTLWDIYCGKLTNMKFAEAINTWNNLCDALCNYDKKHYWRKQFIINHKENQKKEMIWLLPEFTFNKVSEIINVLKQYGVIGSESEVTFYTSETCKVRILAEEKDRKSFNDLFSQPQYLLNYYGIEVIKPVTTDEKVWVQYSPLTVNNANLDEEGKHKKLRFDDLLKKLEKERFITNLRIDTTNPKIVSFSYASPRIRKLLTSAGEIMEIYTYYQVLNQGYFDDVACSYEFMWEDEQVKNELDVVMTKGFRSMIVECKAVQKLTLDYYHKLDSIVGKFGIGAKRVLVGNTYSNNPLHNEGNSMQKSRGMQLNITTISGQTDLENVGEQLVSIMKNRQEGK